MVTDSKYPPSVKAGKPILGETPKGWVRESLKKHLTLEQRTVKVLDEKEYDLVTVKRSRGGVVRREHLYGNQISVKSQFALKEGDFLISKRQIVHGACGIVPAHLDGSIVSNEYSIFTAKDSFDLTYLRYLSETLYFQQTCFHSSIGVHIEKMIFKLDNWFKWDFNLPPLPEQRKIAKILSTWDKAIATTEKLIATSQQQKKALMQQLLTGKKRLLDPETGKAFEGEWDRHSLSDLVYVDKKSLGKNTPDDFEFKYISLSDVATGRIGANLEMHKLATAPSRARRVLQNGDILLSTVRPNLKGFAKISEKHADCIASTGFSVLTPKKRVSADYIYQYIFSSHVTGQIDSLVVGSNYPAINSSDVAGLKVYCPTYEEQQKIASVLTAADKEIELLQAKLAHLKEEKKALMQQLLTGKRRVKVDTTEAA
ncbi:restriction endonuclease subunit S [Edwardsiella tarda]